MYQKSNLIELYPTDKDLWGVNSMRQLLVCRDFKKKAMNNGGIEFKPVNEIFNVMKASIGHKH